MTQVALHGIFQAHQLCSIHRRVSDPLGEQGCCFYVAGQVMGFSLGFGGWVGFLGGKSKFFVLSLVLVKSYDRSSRSRGGIGQQQSVRNGLCRYLYFLILFVGLFGMICKTCWLLNDIILGVQI